MSKFALGRGLGAILGEVEESYLNESGNNRDAVREIPLKNIIPNPFQPRKTFDQQALSELSESIRRHGLLQPVLVIKNGEGYMLIAGERRYRATQLLGEDSIKAVVADIDKTRLRELALIENIQRENLNAIELAQSLRELIDEYGITHEELSETVRKSRSFITNTLRLLNLGSYAKEHLVENRISQGHAKILVGLDEDVQKKVVDSVVGQKLSVRDTENLVASIKKQNHSKVVANDDTPKLKLDELCLAFKSLGLTVQKNKNRLLMQFSSQEEIRQLTTKLTAILR